MLRVTAPLSWREGFALYRRRLTEDSMGEPSVHYDMERPDFVAEKGTKEGICWQSVQSWQSSGRLTSGSRLRPLGETSSGVLEGRIFSDLELAPFDRLMIRGELYEIGNIQHWPGHRKILAQRIG
ncbi:MAG: hypothetical protein IJD21_05505 [Oscillospiraceae bacterium]|nr:hypothetical protein [Oscillospiraceae bacterium]